MAEMGRRIWTKHGALDYKECVGDDLATKWGTTFTRMMKRIVFGGFKTLAE
jgi:uncharacterized protein YbaA (DUF1428 family)